ncbi:MAG: glycosyltransferase family 9 protein [Gammaproteobacteria bacterium]
MAPDGILLISLSNIGDAVMTTPVLQAMHAAFPQNRIDIVGDRRSSEIFIHCPYRGRILHKDKRGVLRGLPALLHELRKNRYELIVDLRTELTAYLLRAGKRLCKWQGKPYGTHAVERHMGVFHAVHGTKPIPSCALWTGAADENYAGQVLQGRGGQKLLAIGPGANSPGKIWPSRNYIRLIEILRGRFQAVVLCGNEKDRLLSQSIAERSALPCIDLCGNTTLLQAAAVLQQASLFIGNDSGLGHMAGAVNTPTITLFGIGQPERYRPWGDRSLWLCGADQKVENISVEEVASRVFSCPQNNGPQKMKPA